MLQPRTEKGREFNTQCLSLAESLNEQRVATEKNILQERSSKGVQTFFEFIQRLPDELAPLDDRMTILFEIDRALAGSYGCMLFTTAYTNDPTKELLRDLGALWQRYFLIGGLTRTDPANGTIPGTRNYYDEWLSIENVGIGSETEYDRIVHNISKMLNSCKNLSVGTKIFLLSFMTEIAKLLGVTEEIASEYLSERHGLKIRERSIDLASNAMGEVLLCLNVLSKKGIDATGIDRFMFDKAIRFWCSKDEFIDGLFSSWGWHWQNDYTSPLAMGDVFKLKQTSELYRTWDDSTAKLGVDISFREFKEHFQKNPTFGSVYKPIPIFMFGTSGVGKTSFMTAFCYNASDRSSASGVVLGRELLAQYGIESESWKEGILSPTGGSPRPYTFGKDLKHRGFEMFDYGGKGIQPGDWEDQLQEMICNARGLIFLLDEQDYYLSPERLRQRSALFVYILQMWMAKNPTVIHIPIAIVLTKADKVFGDSLKDFTRTSFIDPKLKPGLIENLIPERYPKMTEQLRSPYNRLRDYILRDKANNLHPVLQDIIQNLLDNFSQVFNQVVNLTYHYQIFMTASCPPKDSTDKLFPWGVSEPLLWMMDILERFRFQESIVRFDQERRDLENEISMIQEDLRSASRLRDEIEVFNQKKEELLAKRFVSIRKEEIDSLDQQIQNKEKNFHSIVQRYLKDSSLGNKTACISQVSLEIAQKEELLKELNGKREEFANRSRK